MTDLTDPNSIEPVVRNALASAEVHDIHTHLYAPQFGELLLYGVDEMLRFHYIVAEFFRAAGDEISPADFWALPNDKQADLIWQHLFVNRSPISESCRGVATCLQQLGLDPSETSLDAYRSYFAQTDPTSHIDRVLELTNVRSMIMTNDPFDDVERPFWKPDFTCDDRFLAALRIDTLLEGWPRAGKLLTQLGYDVQDDLSGKTVDEVQRFLVDWIDLMRPQYLAASLGPDFRYPADTAGARLLEQCVLPVAADHGLAMGIMIGVRRQVNPDLRLAGDAVGYADISAVTNLCTGFSHNRFLLTALARENQHEMVVTARKFRNLHIFGCWWFVNVPSLQHEITRMRMELLGHTFTPQHSDARVLEQLLYKWHDAKVMLGNVLTEKYTALAETGYKLTAEQIGNEVADLLGGSAMRFIRSSS